jgi:hypothetical protein
MTIIRLQGPPNMDGWGNKLYSLNHRAVRIHAVPTLEDNIMIDKYVILETNTNANYLDQIFKNYLLLA